MKIEQITAEQFAIAMPKFLGQAGRAPLIIRNKKGPLLLIRALHDDDLDELIVANPRFQASIRRGLQR